jgi:hypothetical protein
LISNARRKLNVVASDSRLKIGDLLTQNDGEGWFLLVEETNDGAYVVCRVPPGLLPRDYGVKFVHFPTPEDATGYVIMAPRADRLHS